MVDSGRGVQWLHQPDSGHSHHYRCLQFFQRADFDEAINLRAMLHNDLVWSALTRQNFIAFRK
jgi:hypothetical protein